MTNFFCTIGILIAIGVILLAILEMGSPEEKYEGGHIGRIVGIVAGILVAKTFGLF